MKGASKWDYVRQMSERYQQAKRPKETRGRRRRYIKTMIPTHLKTTLSHKARGNGTKVLQLMTDLHTTSRKLRSHNLPKIIDC